LGDAISSRLEATYETRGIDSVSDEIGKLLSDDEEVDTELYRLAAPDGRMLVGNFSGGLATSLPEGHLVEREVLRLGRPVLCRLLARRLPDGHVVVVGRKMDDQREIERLVVHALAGSGTIVFALAVFGAVIIKRNFNQHILAVRQTVASVDTGDLSKRIPVNEAARDEFSHLSQDINHMLDRIQHLMDGVRQVSNAIAHDLRTPLMRIRGQLDSALCQDDPEKMVAALERATSAIDDVTVLFDKLLLIAEVEAGAIRHVFSPLALAPVLNDIAEMFDAMAEEKGISLEVEAPDGISVVGDRDLLATAVANLVGNALKYAPPGGWVRVRLVAGKTCLHIVVEDNGPGIPASEHGKVVKRFFRLDSARGQPGYGLGLALVAAVAELHHGRLVFADNRPGLAAMIELPAST